MGDRAEDYAPLRALADVKPVGDWTVAHRPDGRRQSAFRSRPVYTYVRDVKSGDRLGEDAASWRQATIEPSEGGPR